MLGYGGMAEVFRGRDIRLSREVAVKVLRSDLARDPSFQMRFRREAQAAASLNHPAIVAVYDTGEEASGGAAVPYIIMEFVEGRTLRDVLAQEGRLTVQRALEITADVCAALEFSHRAGIIHRDIKPGNVMLTRDGVVKVMDFGIARAIAGASATMTQTAAVIGTAQYLSPEQARGEAVDARSDVYSTGVLLFELLTGYPPFRGESPVAIAYQHVREDPQPPSRLDPDIPPDVDAVVMKALAKNPANRYQSAGEFRADLLRAAVGQPVMATPLLPYEGATQALPATQAYPGYQPPVQPPRAAAQRSTRRNVVWIILLAVLALAGVGALAVYQLNKGPSVTVPNIVGATFADAQNRLRAAELQLGTVSYQQDATKQANTVLSQNPAANTSAHKNDKVDVVVNGTGGQVTIPSVVGQAVATATSQLQSLGLVVKTNQVDSGGDSGHRDELLPDTGHEGEQGFHGHAHLRGLAGHGARRCRPVAKRRAEPAGKQGIQRQRAAAAGDEQPGRGAVAEPCGRHPTAARQHRHDRGLAGRQPDDPDQPTADDPDQPTADDTRPAHRRRHRPRRRRPRHPRRRARRRRPRPRSKAEDPERCAVVGRAPSRCSGERGGAQQLDLGGQRLRAPARVRVAAAIEPVAEHHVTPLREHRLRVELHAFDRQVPVPHRHDHPAGGPAGHENVRREGVLLHSERVVARGGKRIGQPGEDAGPVVGHKTHLAVQQLRRAVHDAAERHADGLVTEAHPEQRDAALGALAHQRHADACRLRDPRARGDQHPVDPQPSKLLDADLVVAPHQALRAELAEVLHEVEDERVVVVHDQDPGHRSPSTHRSASGVHDGRAESADGRFVSGLAGASQARDRFRSPPGPPRPIPPRPPVRFRRAGRAAPSPACPGQARRTRPRPGRPAWRRRSLHPAAPAARSCRSRLWAARRETPPSAAPCRAPAALPRSR